MDRYSDAFACIKVAFAVLSLLTIDSAATSVSGAEMTGTVGKVVDCDTFWICDPNACHKIRLCGIDAPEVRVFPYEVSDVQGQSEAMQRGTQHREPRIVDLKELYAKSPPALTKAERAHFDFGANDISTVAANLMPTIRILGQSGFRKPRDVAQQLNKKGLKTACGGKWTPRLAWFLLCFVFDGRVPKQTDAAGKPLRVATPIFSNSQSSIDHSNSPPSGKAEKVQGET